MDKLIKLSVSKSATFQSCKAKYKFTYIIKLPRKEFSYHTLGRFAHRILELFHLAYINGSTDSFDKVMSNSFNESLLEFKGKISLSAKEEVFNIIVSYLNLIKKDKSIVGKVTDVEKVFNLNINDQLILTGMIDRVQIDSDGIYHVVDYKTSKSKTYLKDDTLQLLTYAYVIYKEHPEIKKIRVSYIMLKHNCEFITKEFGLEEILSVKDIYEKFAHDIQTEEKFEANPTKLCLYCDFVSSCQQGLDVIKDTYNSGKTEW